ncbi:MAG TPA: hypothetical protein VFN87_00650 [Solirubrobacteraceae bacterium]|nr:hypothetical protein [Solirubrobacteraceae bacterium]
MATAEVSIIGLGRSSPGASEYIAEMYRRLQRQDRVRFHLNAMGTELKIDERVDKPAHTLQDKVRSVQEKVQ